MNRNFITSLLIILLSAMLFPQTAKSASVIVTNSSDNGPGSLREAVASAMPGDIIEFAPATNGMDFTLISGEILIDKSLTIVGNDSSQTMISGNNLSRIFSISNAGTVILKNLKLTDGNAAGNGGAMMIDNSSVQLISCVVTNSMATVSGGGIFLMGGELTVNGSSFWGNTAGGNAASEGGGAIANAAGNLTIKNGTTVNNNVANGASGSGGGILNNTGGMLTVIGSTISMNHANRAGGGIEDNSGAATVVRLTDVTLSGNSTGSAPGNGGAVHITGPGNMLVTGGMVSGNTATAEGGGLWNGSGEMVISGTVIDGNIASGAPADQGGGGVFNNGGSLTIKNGTTITNNLANGASGSGGGVMNEVGGTLTVIGSTISMNHANRAGGGIEDNSGAATVVRLTDVILSGNTTGPAPGNGGAVHITGPGNMLVTGGMVTSNTATAEGGGLWNGSGEMVISGTVIDGNIASGAPADQGGGGVFNNGGSLTIKNGTTITNNSANGASGSGGGVMNEVGGTLTVIGSTISMNHANRAGGGIEDNSGAATVVRLTDVTLSGNSTGSAPGNGGAVHITGAGDMLISGGMVTGNTAAREGGGLWNGSGKMTVRGVTLDGNMANGPATDDGGGAIFNNGGTLKITLSTISNNFSSGAMGNGGGVHNNNGGVAILYTTISGNSSGNQGGGISNTGTLSVSGSTITQNMAMSNGGGFSQNMTTDMVTFKSTLIAGNMGTGSGQDVFSAGTIKSLGYNLVGQDDLAIFPSKSTDITGTAASPVDPMLDVLANNGGATQTHALLCGSPAIDAGDPGNNSADQRGMIVFNGTRDIGAFELQTGCSVNANRKAGVAFEAAINSQVYPNPATEGWLQIEIPADQIYTQATIRLVDLTTGKTIRENMVSLGSTKMNVSDLVSGTYLVQVISGENMSNHKLIIMN
ncbi:MAG: choice-of-anchor Q domain-containing protein [Bacteroidia bacterium]